MIPSTLLTALKEGFQFLGKKMDALKEAVTTSETKGEMKSAVDTQTKVLTTMAARIEAAVDKLRQIEVQSDVTVDTSALENDLKAITKDIGKLKIPEMKNIETSLKMIYDCIEAGNADMKACITDLNKAISSISLAVPSTFNLNKEQMRELTGSRSSMPMQGGLGTATRVSNTTVAIAGTSTEGTYQFPSATIGWVIKIRDQGTLGYYSWTTGKLPAPAGDGSAYMTIPQNFVRSQQGVDYSGKTIYLAADAAATYEIEVFRQ